MTVGLGVLSYLQETVCLPPSWLVTPPNFHARGHGLDHRLLSRPAPFSAHRPPTRPSRPISAKYEKPWSDAGCSNKLPLPFNNKADRPNYSTQLACCKGAYSGQTSGLCLSQLPSPPTMTPTGSGGAGFWYPHYDTSWNAATCLTRGRFPLEPADVACTTACLPAARVRTPVNRWVRVWYCFPTLLHRVPRARGDWMFITQTT